MLYVTCCFCLHTLLHVVEVVACYWEFLRKVWNRPNFWPNNSPTFFLLSVSRSVAQQCWIRLHSSSNIIGATHAHFTWSLKYYGLYPSPTLMGVLSSVCTLLPTRTQQLPALLVQQWKLLRPFARSFTPTMHSVGQRRNFCNRLPLGNRSEFWNHICLRFCVSHTAAETWKIWDNLRESFSHIF